MASFREIRSILLQSFDDGDISEDEFLLLYDVNTSKNPDFPYECYGKFNLNDMDDSECLSEFRFHKSDLSVLSEALHLPNYFICQQGTICDGIEGLCITLRRFAYPCRLSDLIPRFGRPVPELSMISSNIFPVPLGHDSRRRHPPPSDLKVPNDSSSAERRIDFAVFFIVLWSYGTVGKYALICAMEIQKIHMVVHIFSGFALFTESECIAELNPSASC